MKCASCSSSAKYRCCHVLYCSESCQKRDFPVHQKECSHPLVEIHRVLIGGQEPVEKKHKTQDVRPIDWEELKRTELFKILGRYLDRYLNNRDIKNLSLASWTLRLGVLRSLFDRHAVVVRRNFSEEMHRMIGSLASRVIIDDVETLNRWGHFDVITNLSFAWDFNQPLRGVRFPDGLTHLTFGTYFNQSLQGIRFPDGLTHLTFGGVDFNQPLQGVRFPDGLTHLTFGDEFDQPLQGVRFPDGLTHLTFGHRFNQPLQGIRFPDGLTHLSFGFHFIQSLQGVRWPPGLTFLSFQRASLPEFLPEWLIRITKLEN
jgi:hypothetical protein